MNYLLSLRFYWKNTVSVVRVFVLEVSADILDCANYIVWKVEIHADVLVSTE